MTIELDGAYGIEPVSPSTPGAMICGTCGRAWADDITPAGRCPWEDRHGDDTPAPAPGIESGGFLEVVHAYDDAHDTPTRAEREQAAARLPLPKEIEPYRPDYSPEGIAARWAVGVGYVARELRHALAAAEIENPMARLSALADVEDHARELLHLLGETPETD